MLHNLTEVSGLKITVLSCDYLSETNVMGISDDRYLVYNFLISCRNMSVLNNILHRLQPLNIGFMLWRKINFILLPDQDWSASGFLASLVNRNIHLKDHWFQAMALTSRKNRVGYFHSIIINSTPIYELPPPKIKSNTNHTTATTGSTTTTNA